MPKVPIYSRIPPEWDADLELLVEPYRSKSDLIAQGVALLISTHAMQQELARKKGKPAEPVREYLNEITGDQSL